MSGRIRTIKPEILEDREAVDLTDAAWRMWVSLWTLADDHGNVRLDERYVASRVWQDTTREPEIPDLVAELVRGRRIDVYVVRAQPFGHVRNWEKHQRIDKRNAPRVPLPSDADGTDYEAFLNAYAGSASLRKPPHDSTTCREIGCLACARARASGNADHDHDHDHETTTAPSASAEVPAERITKSKAGSRGTRIAADWEPSEKTVEWCHQQGVDAAAHVDEFRDYWVAVSGAKGCKLDWDATFKNRIRQLIESDRAAPWSGPIASSKVVEPTDGEKRGPPPPGLFERMKSIGAPLIEAASAPVHFVPKPKEAT